jgi:hypothetical protein
MRRKGVKYLYKRSYVTQEEKTCYTHEELMVQSSERKQDEKKGFGKGRSLVRVCRQ